jgi:hypothetical protein
MKLFIGNINIYGLALVVRGRLRQTWRHCFDVLFVKFSQFSIPRNLLRKHDLFPKSKKNKVPKEPRTSETFCFPSAVFFLLRFVVSWFAQFWKIWSENNVSWFAHLWKTWLENNVFWFVYLWEPWLGNIVNVFWFVRFGQYK